jgi:molybdopterin converting factor small subunit
VSGAAGVKVRIPQTLLSYTGQKTLVEANGATVDEVLRDLDRRFRGFRFRMVDEQDQIRPHIKVFVNREQIRDLATTLSAADEVTIVQAFSGG